MRHLIVRLQLTWLTFAAVVAVILVTALGPRGGGVDVHFARSSEQFKAALQRASADDAASGLAADGISIKTVNTFRAGLAADMLFLVAYDPALAPGGQTPLRPPGVRPRSDPL